MAKEHEETDGEYDEVDEEVESGDEPEEEFNEYEKKTKQPILSRMWNGIKNIFSSDSGDEDSDETEDSEDHDKDDNKDVDKESAEESKPAQPAPAAKSEERKISLNDIQDDDMGKMIKITVGILQKLPQNEFEKFKQSDDFASYKEIVKKYKKR